MTWLILNNLSNTNNGFYGHSFFYIILYNITQERMLCSCFRLMWDSIYIWDIFALDKAIDNWWN